MRYLIKVSLVFIASFLLDSANGRCENLQIHYIGHATVLIESQNTNLLTDPFFGDHILWDLERKTPPATEVTQLPRIDIVLISHTHSDHYDLDTIKKLSNKPTVVMPWGRGGALEKLGFPTIELCPWETYSQDGFQIIAVPAKHMWGHCLGYIIKMQGTTIYFTGDTKRFKGLDRLSEYKIDIMLLPYGGTPVVGSIWTTRQAAEVVSQIHPKIFIPIHWGTFKRWWTKKEPETPETFCNIVKELSSEIRGVILQVGEKLTFDSKEP